MTPALWFALADLALVLVVDFLFWAFPRYFPGWSISEGIRKLATKRPVIWRIGYILLAVFLFWHLMLVKP